MGMTIDEFDEYAKSHDILTMTREFYEHRLKAVLTELQLEISELKSYESADGQDLVMLADIVTLFQQKINNLKED